MSSMIPLSIPNFEGNEKKYVNDALEQGWVSTGGAYISRLEKDLADFLDVQNVAACQSGTAALHLALIEAGVEAGDIVLVPPVTFIAAVNPVKYLLARPVFIDCDESLCMDPAKLRSFCEDECVMVDGQLLFDDRPVKAIIVVHVFGNMADMDRILKIADTYHLKVIEDATEALGTYYTEGRFKKRYAGTIGHFGAFSFNGNKIITTGGGGAVTSGVCSKVDHMRFLSTQAKTDPQYYIHDELGYNYRMTNLQAALGVAQMEELPEFIRRKQANYHLYADLLRNFELADLVPFRNGTCSNQWFYSVLIHRQWVKAPLRVIIDSLEHKGIQTRAIWGLINEQTPYKGEYCYRLEKAPYYADRILNIPCSTQITRDEIEYVAASLKETLQDLSISGLSVMPEGI